LFSHSLFSPVIAKPMDNPKTVLIPHLVFTALKDGANEIAPRFEWGLFTSLDGALLATT